MLSTLLIVAGFSAALGCAPGSTTGPAYSKATYEFVVLPPLSWSYPPQGVNKVGDQSDDKDKAVAKYTADVTDCLTKTLKENNVPTGNVTYTINLAAIEATIVSPCSATAGEYAQYKGSLYYACGATVSMAESTGSIVFTSGTPITANQWNAIAVNVQDRLTALKVIFTANVKVKYQ